MIAGCPKCSARYRIDAAKLGAEGARLRCTQCEAIFRVTPPPTEVAVTSPAPARPAEIPQTPQPTPAAAVAPPPSERTTGAAQAPAPSPAPASHAPTGPTVLIADPDVTSAKSTGHAVAEWGFSPILVHDGVEAILTIQRSLPSVVVLDAALPKMFGFQICELLKRNEQLGSIHVVLVGAIHDEDRYRRAPSELYGADAYVERPQLPEALRPMLERFQSGATARDVASGPSASPASAVAGAVAPETPATPAVGSAPAPVVAPVAAPVVAPAPVATSTPAPAPAPSTPAPAPAPVAPSSPAAAVAPSTPAPAAAPGAVEPPEAAPEIVAAERLARIVVSDIVLYNPERFEEGIQKGNVVEALSAELEEGRSLFETRVDAKVRQDRDFLADELVRVARSRGMS